MSEYRLTIRLDQQTLIALQRLATAEDRSRAAQVRVLIREEAMRRALWQPELTQVKRRA